MSQTASHPMRCWCVLAYKLFLAEIGWASFRLWRWRLTLLLRQMNRGFTRIFEILYRLSFTTSKNHRTWIESLEGRNFLQNKLSQTPELKIKFLIFWAIFQKLPWKYDFVGENFREWPKKLAKLSAFKVFLSPRAYFLFFSSSGPVAALIFLCS